MGPTAAGCCVRGLLSDTENSTLNSLTTAGPAGVSSSVATCMPAGRHHSMPPWVTDHLGLLWDFRNSTSNSLTTAGPAAI